MKGLRSLGLRVDALGIYLRVPIIMISLYKSLKGRLFRVKVRVGVDVAARWSVACGVLLDMRIWVGSSSR